VRLERIGDLVMTLPALDDVRALAPGAEIDLVVGSWNESLAKAIPSVNRVLTLDPQWLAREATGLTLPALLRAARAWRELRYDLGINFEPDVRSNLLLAASGAAWTAGWTSGGGGPLLDTALDYDPRAHTIANGRRLVAEAFAQPVREATRPRIAIPETAAREAATRLRRQGTTTTPRSLIGVHVSGGRAIKQWDPDRFAAVAARLIEARNAVIVLTGGPADRALVDEVKRTLPAESVIDVAGDADLLVLAALLERMDLFVTGDTGPMHLATAVGTPVVAVFGPSAPARYAPTGQYDRVVRVDLPCSPCNRIRQPPARCVGHTPDCLTAVSIEQVLDAAIAILDASAASAPVARRS
jgi:ADP-heptose:LPS heptosyltransferase